MRNKYSKEFENYMIKYSKYHTLNELLNISKDMFNYNISKDILRRYLSRREIRYKDYNNLKIHVPKNYPVGTEIKRTDGYTIIKTENKKWVQKQRYIYETYYQCKLPKNIKIIFLDGNKSNFDIENLMAIEEKEFNYARNKGLLSKDPKINKIAFTLAKINYKTKEIESKNMI